MAAATAVPHSQFDSSELRSVFTDSAAIVTEINSSQNDTARLAELIGADPILSLRVMTVANAASYAIGNTSNSIKYAIARLGIEALKAIVVKELISRQFSETDPDIDTLKQLVRHSASCACCASYLGAMFPELDTSVLYTAGLFHDIGKFIILKSVQAAPAACLRPYFANDGRTNDLVLWRYDHAAVGALALAQWNVDNMLCTLTRSHHLPAAVEAPHAGGTLAKYLSILFIANQFSKYFDQTSKNFLECLAPRLHPIVPLNAIRALLTNSNILMDLTRIHYLLKS
ncbi:HDOD domain-containing protein [Solidesulfovibrio sp.]